MCPTRIQSKVQPIELDLTAAFSFERGFGRAELLQLSPQLERCRQVIINASAAGASLDVALPQRMLSEYHRQRKNCLLGQILARAKQFREVLDSAVILGTSQQIAAAQALFSACGHPHHNSLSRGQRGGRPRVYFLPAIPDNDALQALLDVLPHGHLIRNIEDRWGIIATDEFVSSEDGNSDIKASQLLTGMFSLLWDKLQSTTTVAEESQLAIVVVSQGSPLLALAEQIGLSQIEAGTPHGSVDIGDPRLPIKPVGFFSPGVLLAAAVMGLDIVKLLHGAAMMWDRFATAPPGNNSALDLAGLCHLLSARFGNDCCTIESIEALRPLAEIFCHRSHVVPQSEPLLIRWLPQDCRTDRLSVKIAVGSGSADRQKSKDQRLANLAAEAAEADRIARTATGKFTAVVKIPLVDEGAIGQLIEMHRLAAAVEDALIFVRLSPGSIKHS